MDGNKYRSYIKDKYKITDNTKFNSYMLLDIMEKIILNFPWPETTIFKGAANLFFEQKYIREPGLLTRDLDFAIKKETNQYKEEMKVLFPFETDIYTYNLISFANLTIATSFYDGFVIKLKVNIKNLNIQHTLNMDFAIEDLNIKNLASSINTKILSYSIEQTIAEKFISMVHHGRTNGREKDFIDLKFFYNQIDKKYLKKLILKYFDARINNKSLISKFKNEFREYKFVKKYKLQKIIFEILESLKN